MRIEFAQGVHEPVTWIGGTLSIGSAGDSDVRLEGSGVATRHARLTCDRRGLVLDVVRGAGHVYVNARPVREHALLRLGDALGVGSCRLRLCADAVADGEGTDASSGAGDASMALRAVAGPWSGRVWPLSGKLGLGAQGPVEAAQGAVLVLLADGHGAWMDASALDATAAVRVNGVRARRARLGDGDQLVIGTDHYILDVSARPQPASPMPDTPDEATTPGTVRTRAPHREAGWLVATAVLLALVLAWVLLAHY